MKGISMNRKHLLLTLAATALTLGIQSASAADLPPVVESPSWYVSLFGGVSFMDELETSYSIYATPGYSADVETDLGFLVGGAIGTHLSDDFRVELEVAYSQHDVDKVNFCYAGCTTSGGVGDFGILTFMGNLWWDMPLGSNFSPYIGGGAGLAIVDANGVGYAPPGIPAFDGSEVAFAFQLGAGLRWMAWEGGSFDIGYRFRGIDGPTFDNIGAPGLSDFDADFFFSHNIIAGITFGF